MNFETVVFFENTQQLEPLLCGFMSSSRKTLIQYLYLDFFLAYYVLFNFKMEKLNELLIDLTQNDALLSDEQNLNLIWVDLERGSFLFTN